MVAKFRSSFSYVNAGVSVSRYVENKLVAMSNRAYGNSFAITTTETQRYSISRQH